MNRAIKIAQFPLRAPRQLTLMWWPVHLVADVIACYHDTFFAVLDGREVTR